MPSWALVVTLGPVGGFIASGRRSRDLWWGSTWLSECTCEVAASLLDRPAAEGVAARLLVPSERRVREIRESNEGQRAAYGGRVTNHVEAEVTAPSAAEVEELARSCEATARKYLSNQLRHRFEAFKEQSSRRKRRLRRALDDVVERHLFDAQVDAIEKGDFIEVYAAWAPVGEDGLPSALRRAWTLLDGRKRARLFEAPAWARDGRAKCDLDPGRDSVLHTANTRDRRVGGREASRRHLARRVLGIGPEEELDALGLARRLAAFTPGPDLKPLPFPPVSRVAVDPWIERVNEHAASAALLRNVRSFLESDEVQSNPFFFSWCSPARDPQTRYDPAARRRGEGIFPFDASILFEGGLDALLEEVRRAQKRGRGAASDDLREELAGARRHLETLRPWVGELHRLHRAPVPYYALLAMDGDGVGHALLAERDLERKAELVAALDEFADRAAEIVREHHGCAFYAGGDDLAAYLPLDRVLGAAAALAAAFEAVQATFPTDSGVSISAGIALAHVKADLRAVRARAQRALADAKRERRKGRAEWGAAPARGWATVVDLPRSGEERTACGPLSELLADLEQWRALLEAGGLSLRSGGFLTDLAQRLGDPSADAGGHRAIELARYRLLAQSRRSEKKASPRLEERLEEIRTEGWSGALRLAAELAIASRLRKARAASTVEEQPPAEGAA